MDINLERMMTEACNTRISVPVSHSMKARYEKVGQLLKQYANQSKGAGKLPIHEITRQMLDDMLSQLEKQIAVKSR